MATTLIETLHYLVSPYLGTAPNLNNLVDTIAEDEGLTGPNGNQTRANNYHLQTLSPPGLHHTVHYSGHWTDRLPAPLAEHQVGLHRGQGPVGDPCFQFNSK